MLSSASGRDDRDLYSGLIRLHVLHHAVKGPIFGLGMIEELSRHGYCISPGTLYPLLQGLEKKGYLDSAQHRDGKSLRKVYTENAASAGSSGGPAEEQSLACLQIHSAAAPRFGPTEM